eukprot:14999732-Ditylum_brightwellii.AAC.1
MKISKDFLREAIQLVPTKKPQITFEVDGDVDKKTGESRTFKPCMQPRKENSPIYSLTIEVVELVSPKEWLVFKYQVKPVLKGQNIGSMDAAYRLVQDLLRGDAMTAINNHHVMLKDQTTDNLDYCLTAVAVHVS